jgi:hypothetical protein
MSRLNIDLRNDPEIPAGRELIEHLVGAHMVAGDEEELLHLVRHSIDGLHSTTPEKSIRLLAHAAYHGQALIVRLLDLAANQQIQLQDADIHHNGAPTQDSERHREQRLDLWTRLRDDQD